MEKWNVEEESGKDETTLQEKQDGKMGSREQKSKKTGSEKEKKSKEKKGKQ